MTSEVLHDTDTERDTSTARWIGVGELTHHPRNPRVGRPDKLDSIIESMRTLGYRAEKPMLVRPHGEGYQIIGGHSRHTAALAAGIESVLCVVREMDDDSAILAIAEDNLNDPLPWYSICLYVHLNAVKDSKKGLSRTALVSAATGKVGNSAEHDGRRLGPAGEVIAHLIEQSANVGGLLLDPDKPRTLHLVELAQAERTHWPMLAGMLVEHDWSVKDSKAAVDRVNAVSAATPTWLACDLTATMARAAIEPGHAKSLASALAKMGELHDKLPTSTMSDRQWARELDPHTFDIACRRIEDAQRQASFDMEPAA